ncbi:putative HIG1 domain family member 2A, mitochondrial [Penaeus vannamei]|uniref:Putative HIG1 domain family member 2A, mitochondrial n=2 Tax=Penaeus vannamei TaxID=6689 RepID=A0A3R7P4R5_PENVA|nr:putative HIG1 domain family member 2A, mitochondrial [Penaeus vannamei]
MASQSTGVREEFTELDWITLKSDIGSEEIIHTETAGEKFKRKFKENPLVPIGCGLTAGALCFGLLSFSRGNRRTSQNMMRLRIAAQGFTVAALMIGIVKTSLK